MLQIIETMLAMLNKINVHGREDIARMHHCITTLEQLRVMLKEQPKQAEEDKAPE